MAKRHPQINFQVDPAMKLLYEEAKAAGHWVTRFCAAGLLAMVEDPHLRLRALNRLREWEASFHDADPEQIRDFVQGAAIAMQSAAPDSPPTPKARRLKTTVKRKRSG